MFNLQNFELSNCEGFDKLDCEDFGCWIYNDKKNKEDLFEVDESRLKLIVDKLANGISVYDFTIHVFVLY